MPLRLAPDGQASTRHPLAGGDYRIAYPACEQTMSTYVQHWRVGLCPPTRAQAWAMTTGVTLVTSLPTPVMDAISRRGTRLGLHDSVAPRDYPNLVERPRGYGGSDPSN